MDQFDAVFVGSGPNALVGAALLARAGWRVLVLERSSVPGGAVHSDSLTAPGYVHDTYSAFYGMLHASPVFHELELDRRVQWAQFPVPVSALVGPESVARTLLDGAATADELALRSPADADAWLGLCRWWDRVGRHFLDLMLAPLGAAALAPGSRFAAAAGADLLAVSRMLVEPMEALARARFTTPAAQVLLAGGTSHTDVGVDQPGSVPAALILALVAQTLGMPVPVGGAGRLAAALAAAVTDAGGRILCDHRVSRIVVERGRAAAVSTVDGASFTARRAVVADTGPGILFRQLVDPVVLPPRFLDGLRQFRYGTGVFKVDLALDGPVPWAAPGLARSGVVHITGDLDNMAEAAFQARRGILPSLPMLIVGQQSTADTSRAPAGGHTLWVETHVPSVPRASGSWDGSTRDRFLEVVLQRLETHAPGLGSRIVGTAVRTPPDLEAENPNLVGGDLGAGSSAIDQQLIFRPVPGWFRYATPVRGLYLCSASAHPGGGVHGMVGRNCAHRILGDARRRRI
ncbi:MAG TPA: NAD(P)/FAD-dependent oxidoreductase [Acidimicrobiales bacterium]|nr:NAD(P)/FAD-dependent oxidoreductase [Acidimicrobiales bacterium]